MSPIVETMRHPVAYRLGWVLLHSLWQGALVGVAFALCRLALKNSSPNARYLAGCIALGLLIVIPAITFLSQPATMFDNESASEVLQPGRTLVGAAVHSSSNFGIGAETFVRSGAGWLWNAAPWIVAAWLFGVTFCSVRLMRGCWWVRTIRTTENEPVNAPLLVLLNDLRRRLGISRPVRLLKSALVEVPTVVGWLRPVILLPAATLTGLTCQQLEAIIAHELAHVRRFDYVVNAFQCVVEALMFYHPVVWWISRLVREEREHCCDDLVVRVCGNRLAYARALATLEAFRSELPQFAFAASGGSLSNRIRRLFGMALDDKSSGGSQLGGLVLLGIGLVLTISGIYLMLTPDTYQAKVCIKLERDASDSNQEDFKNSDHSYSPYFIQTELAIIRSRLLLSKAAMRLDLPVVWGKERNNGTPLTLDEALALLRSSVDLQPVPDTSLVEIAVYGDDPEEAAKIANTIAEVYRDNCLQLRHDLASSGIEALAKRYQEQEDLVRKIQNEADVLRTNLDISDDDAQGNAPAPVLDNEMLRKFEQQQIEYENKLIASERLVAQLEPLEMQKLKEVLPTTVPDATLTELLGQLNAAEQRVALMQKSLGETHPDYVGAKKLMDTINKQIEARVMGIMTSLRTQSAICRSQLVNVEKRVAEAKEIEHEKTARSRPYYDKKRELESAMRFRDILKLKIESEKVDMNLPKRAMVTIVDGAVPPRRPSSPNRVRAGALILFGLLLDAGGLATISAGRRSKRVQRE